MGLFDNFNFDKLKDGLAKTRKKLADTFKEEMTGRAVINEDLLDHIEENLITSDLGFDLTERVMDRTRYFFRLKSDRSNNSLIQTVKEELQKVLEHGDQHLHKTLEQELPKFKPYIILIIGVNGVGKTTTVGKLAHNFRKAGLKVIVGAADTFRAAANEQLEIWAKRADVEIIQKGKGADPSAVAFETVQKAVNEKYDVVLIDTAGRLHNKTHLMEELNKIRRVMGKVVDHAPNETLLVLDGTTGQNALVQVSEFSKVTDITGLIITKLDGTAKGGVVFQIVAKQKIPVKYIGVGEGIDDLQTFDTKQFISAIFDVN
jgi:fused signal recognition particle receptor